MPKQENCGIQKGSSNLLSRSNSSKMSPSWTILVNNNLQKGTEKKKKKEWELQWSVSQCHHVIKLIISPLQMHKQLCQESLIPLVFSRIFTNYFAKLKELTNGEKQKLTYVLGNRVIDINKMLPVNKEQPVFLIRSLAFWISSQLIIINQIQASLQIQVKQNLLYNWIWRIVLQWIRMRLHQNVKINKSINLSTVIHQYFVILYN